MDKTYGFTKKYLTKDEKPWFPVMGEIHFSRYRADLWEESLSKMKAGGLSIASVYVIWIHHGKEQRCFEGYTFLSIPSFWFGKNPMSPDKTLSSDSLNW